MKNYKISIIIAVLNRASVIEQAISSVVNQTYKNIELIIIDGGSTDGTVDIIKKYSNKIACWISEPDKGISDAINKGILASTGDYIQIIGSDDCLISYDIIEKVADSIDCDTDILSGNCYVVGEIYKRQRLFTNKIACNRRFYKGGMVPHSGMFVRRKLYLKYPLDVNYRIVSDYKFFLICYSNPSIIFKFIDLPISFFADSGISAQLLDLAYVEAARMHHELNLQYEKDPVYNKISRTIKKTLRLTGLLNCVINFKRKYFGEKHHCNNKICRWCNRYEP